MTISLPETMSGSHLMPPIREIPGIIRTLRRARLLAAMRPDRYVRMAVAGWRDGMGITSGFASAAQRCPDNIGLIDEAGALTWRQIDQGCNAFAAALRALPASRTRSIGIMCRNHRGFVYALVAATRVGADVLLLNTAFAGPALAEVVHREHIDTVIYDDEFTDVVDRAITDRPDTARIVAWAAECAPHDHTVDNMIDAYRGRRPARAHRKGRLVLLTSGTTGAPKGAKMSGGGITELKAVLDRVPWRAEETTMVAAPMFHAWGFSQLAFAALMACTIVTRHTFDAEATLELIDRYGATGLCVVPVMLDRIMELPDEVRNHYSGRTLRFVTASGSRMRPDIVIAFMDQFGDVVYNNYNSTEAGMIATATPLDLRAAPSTAGKPAPGTDLRILDGQFNDAPTGEIGQIFVRNNTLFDGYTSGATKHFHNGYMASGDMGYVDDAGRLFVVGRDDEMIVSGGENVYPTEVEKTLAAHPHVVEAAVIGVDDDKYGQRLVAFVVAEPAASLSAEALKQHVRDNLANYKVPRDIYLLDHLPRGNTGKILRSELHSYTAARPT